MNSNTPSTSKSDTKKSLKGKKRGYEEASHEYEARQDKKFESFMDRFEKIEEENWKLMEKMDENSNKLIIELAKLLK